MVSDLSWFDPDAVESLYPGIRSVLESSPYMSGDRVDAVMDLLSSRMDSLRRRLRAFSSYLDPIKVLIR